MHVFLHGLYWHFAAHTTGAASNKQLFRYIIVTVGCYLNEQYHAVVSPRVMWCFNISACCDFHLNTTCDIYLDTSEVELEPCFNSLIGQYHKSEQLLVRQTTFIIKYIRKRKSDAIVSTSQTHDMISYLFGNRNIGWFQHRQVHRVALPPFNKTNT